MLAHRVLFSGYDPTRHPRAPAGVHEGGQFIGETASYQYDLSEVTPECIDRVSRALRKPVTAHDMALFAGAPNGARVVTVLDRQGNVIIRAKTDEWKGTRTLHVDGYDQFIKNENMDVAESAQGKGIGTRSLVDQVAHASKFGFQQIETLAAAPLHHSMSSTVNGYYTWAKLGYDGEIRPEAARALRYPYSEANTIHELFSMKGGPEEWKKRGSWFMGVFDLREGSRSMAILRKYAQAKGIHTHFDDTLSMDDEEILDEIWGRVQKHGWQALGGSPIGRHDAHAHFAWDPSRHPHEPAGSSIGGRFARVLEALGITTPTSAEQPQRDRGYKVKELGPLVLDQVSRALGKRITVQDLGELAGAPDGSHIQAARVNEFEGKRTLLIRCDHDHWTGVRILNLDNRVIKNALMTVSPEVQGNGIGVRALATQVDTAVRLGFKEIHTNCAGNKGSDYNGYYTWARLGYDGPIPDEFRPRLPAEYRQAKTIHQLFAMRGGPEAWKEHGGDWDGEFDLSGGSHSRAILRAYCQKKGVHVSFAHVSGKKSDYFPPGCDDEKLSPEDEKILDDIWRKVQEGGWESIGATETSFSFDPSRHPHEPAGSSIGGRFAHISTPAGVSAQPDRKYKVTGVDEMMLADLSKFIGKKVTAQDIGELSGAPDGSMVEVGRSSRSALTVRSYSTGWKSLRVIEFKGTPEITNAFMSVDKEYQGKNLGTISLAKQVDAAVRMGFERIVTTCAGDRDSDYNGYYTWAKLGYNGQIPQEYHDRLPGQYGRARTIQQLFAMKGGPEIWKDRGGEWEGIFSLHEGSLSRRILREYSQRKGIHVSFANGPVLGPDTDPPRGDDDKLSPEDEEILDDIWRKIQEEGWDSLDDVGFDWNEDKVVRVPAGTKGGGQFAKRGVPTAGDEDHPDKVKYDTSKITRETLNWFWKTTGKSVTAHDIGLMIGAPNGASIIQLTTTGDRGVNIYGETDKWHTNVFFDANGVMNNNSISVDRSLHGQGIGTASLVRQARAASDFGFKKITAYCVGRKASPIYNGYSTWAKLGFDGDVSDIIEAFLPAQFHSAKTIHELMAMKGGPAAWKEHGDAWDGVFDLKHGSKSMKILQAYARAKKIKFSVDDFVPDDTLTPEDEEILDRIWAQVQEHGWDSLDDIEFAWDESKRHRAPKGTSEGGRFISKQTAFTLRADIAMKEAGIKGEDAKIYMEAIKRAVDKMPRPAFHKFWANLGHIRVYPDVHACTASFLACGGKPIQGKTVPAFCLTSRVTQKAELHIDGNEGDPDRVRGVFHNIAHEIGHVIDGPSWSERCISKTSSWHGAWQEEIKQPGNPLSLYATRTAREGFAEFVRLIAVTSSDYVKSAFPMCWRVTKQHGIV